MRQPNRLPAFTLLESLLVLFTVSFFVLLPTLALQRWQKILAVEAFFFRFEKSILNTQQAAITRRTATGILWDKKTKQTIYFFGAGTFDEELHIPVELSITGLDTIVFPSKSANYAQMTTITFRWPDAKKVVKYKFLFGSGRYQKIIE